ncbi:Glycosyltransferase, catalytic subunit of cellulose synthase and poly-beta-1,6-N-acetylglucosamine synthase [Desulfocicer vacuolatum DSM 3385]|uniref:Glycosyltransferase, catalytic subunit of cellulose synthase and poly-beta-1,6-N-acetylglucosamine synthase n=1 Tax=Desulfocicer vacuolatum DSM 3385 TaxID=1121400 RepID=A0A1W1ZPS0_9BACT|nr:glycosyltransferase family 2 protein [Desulfocicer vacuolatum]SMC50357.1 Glycosyltransferase, catalytic subunit of cellulose synthase and poly-beta-1,6-N-acetylglucosamine synthase [Desulfocicer vacuolatum DSM 3385]
MEDIIFLIFWVSVGMVVYAYVGYPACLMGLSLFRKSGRVETDSKGWELPRVSFIITAYNEEKQIAEKLQRTLSQDYPQEKLEIIVASDCSTDKTDIIVEGFGRGRIKLVRAPERRGKEFAQKYAIEIAKGDILIFSDVATSLDVQGLRTIIQNFKDPSIGCVSSEDRFIDAEGNISGEGIYVKYEMFLRKLESQVNSLVGLSGSFFAARRSVCCHNWATDLPSDFNTLLNTIRSNMKGVIDPATIGYYKNITDEKKEFNRKVRTVLRGISVFMRNFSLLNPWRYGLFSWQLFSHKLCRWMVPFFLIIIMFTNILLVQRTGYLFLLLIQGGFYSISLFWYILRDTAWAKEGHKMISWVKIPFFFISVNSAIALAWWKYAMGDRATFWEPSKR